MTVTKICVCMKNNLEFYSDSSPFFVDYIIDIKHGGRPISKRRTKCYEHYPWCCSYCMPRSRNSHFLSKIPESSLLPPADNQVAPQPGTPLTLVNGIILYAQYTNSVLSLQSTKSYKKPVCKTVAVYRRDSLLFSLEGWQTYCKYVPNWLSYFNKCQIKFVQWTELIYSAL